MRMGFGSKKLSWWEMMVEALQQLVREFEKK
jgi:hypothetical protein